MVNKVVVCSEKEMILGENVDHFGFVKYHALNMYLYVYRV